MLLTFVSVDAGANRKMDDDGIMVSIYEDIQDELKDRTEVVKEKQQMVSQSISFFLCLLLLLLFLCVCEPRQSESVPLVFASAR